MPAAQDLAASVSQLQIGPLAVPAAQDLAAATTLVQAAALALPAAQALASDFRQVDRALARRQYSGLTRRRFARVARHLGLTVSRGGSRVARDETFARLIDERGTTLQPVGYYDEHVTDMHTGAALLKAESLAYVEWRREPEVRVGPLRVSEVVFRDALREAIRAVYRTRPIRPADGRLSQDLPFYPVAERVRRHFGSAVHLTTHIIAKRARQITSLTITNANGLWIRRDAAFHSFLRQPILPTLNGSSWK